jgi:hypothetical protein
MGLMNKAFDIPLACSQLLLDKTSTASWATFLDVQVNYNDIRRTDSRELL